jgi:hypothetical protein
MPGLQLHVALEHARPRHKGVKRALVRVGTTYERLRARADRAAFQALK